MVENGVALPGSAAPSASPVMCPPSAPLRQASGLPAQEEHAHHVQRRAARGEQANQIDGGGGKACRLGRASASGRGPRGQVSQQHVDGMEGQPRAHIRQERGDKEEGQAERADPLTLLVVAGALTLVLARGRCSPRQGLAIGRYERDP